jgi:excisionase family DNA binding protein
MATITAGEWITLSRAARELNCSSQWVKRMAEGGRLRFIKTELGRLVNQEDVHTLARTYRNSRAPQDDTQRAS